MFFFDFVLSVNGKQLKKAMPALKVITAYQMKYASTKPANKNQVFISWFLCKFFIYLIFLLVSIKSLSEGLNLLVRDTTLKLKNMVLFKA